MTRKNFIDLDLYIMGEIKAADLLLVMLRNEESDYCIEEMIVFSSDTCTWLNIITERCSE
jgi:hypothetical protein